MEIPPPGWHFVNSVVFRKPAQYISWLVQPTRQYINKGHHQKYHLTSRVRHLVIRRQISEYSMHCNLCHPILYVSTNHRTIELTNQISRCWWFRWPETERSRVIWIRASFQKTYICACTGFGSVKLIRNAIPHTLQGEFTVTFWLFTTGSTK